MSEEWYFVQDSKRIGPVTFVKLSSMIEERELLEEDYVWKKGFSNWMKIKDVPEFFKEEVDSFAIPPAIKELDLVKESHQEKIFFIKTGRDRGGQEVEYGPFSIEILKRLFDEKRINGKTLIFTQGLSEWIFLADATGYEEVFGGMPPVITAEDKRKNKRKPFIARMFIQNQKKVFEGICRDISIGGMQVLVDNFPGAAHERININVHPENTEHTFVASGEIVRLLEGGQGFSFRFVDLTEEARTSIESYLKE